VSFAWAVPERFNFARDVVEPESGLAITFVSAGGEQREVSFDEVNARAGQWTNHLARAGVEQGDRVLVLVGKTLEWHPIMLALLKLGAVSIPCSEMLRHKDLAFRVEHSGARLVVTDRGTDDHRLPTRDPDGSGGRDDSLSRHQRVGSPVGGRPR